MVIKHGSTNNPRRMHKGRPAVFPSWNLLTAPLGLVTAKFPDASALPQSSQMPQALPAFSTLPNPLEHSSVRWFREQRKSWESAPMFAASAPQLQSDPLADYQTEG